MTSKEFIDLNKALGHKVIDSKNYSWLIRNDKSAISIPSLIDIFPEKEELNQMLKHARILNFKTKCKTKNSKEYLFKGKSYTIEDFSSKIRNQIRKGLKSCEIKEAKLDELKIEGLKINKKTLLKHNREVSYLQDQTKWEKYITTLNKNSDISIKAAYIDNKLIAYIVFIKVENKTYIYHPFMNFKYSSSNPMNALLYTYINKEIEKNGEIIISYGLSSFSDKKGLDKFKKGMLFTEEETSRITVLSPLYYTLINKISLTVASLFLKTKIINNNTFEKIKYLYLEKKNYKTYINKVN